MQMGKTLKTSNICGYNGRHSDRMKMFMCRGCGSSLGFKNKSLEKLLPWNFQETSFASQNGPKKP